MARAADHPTHLAPPAGIGQVAAHPKRIALACIVALAGFGWLYLGVLAAGVQGAMGIDRALIDALCRPSFGRAGSGLSFALDAALVFSMWCAMVLAMMLPTAGPMVVTYAELADTAARKGERAVSPIVLTAGYCVVWLGFALAATALQIVLTRTAVLDPAMSSAGPLLSGAILLGAGLYQFSALKEACVKSCQRPFPFFFANWSSKPRGIFRLGIVQGAYCLGCCWAMMMVMFAVGLMNVLWMAALGMVMTAEKMATTMRVSRVVGAVLIVIGIGFIATAIAAHWPALSM
jgi:predicted metal-binding membrane protein